MVVWHDGKAELVPLERVDDPNWAAKKRRRSKSPRPSPKRKFAGKNKSRVSASRKNLRKPAKG